MEEINFQNSLEDTKQGGNKGIIIGIAGFILIFAIICWIVIDVPSDSGYLTYNNYAKIKNEMTYSQVVEIFDQHQGKLNSTSSYGGYTLSIYSWSNRSGTKYVVVGFENNRVYTKSQYGLR